MERLPAYDCHCHILPGLDDGAQTMEDSLFLAGKLASYGFQRAVCTSHSTRLYRNTPSTVIPACERLQEALVQAGIRLELVPSLEYRLLPETWPEIRTKGWLLPWEGNHILIELPISNPRQLGGIDPAAEIRALLADGFQPDPGAPGRRLPARPGPSGALPLGLRRRLPALARRWRGLPAQSRFARRLLRPRPRRPRRPPPPRRFLHLPRHRHPQPQVHRRLRRNPEVTRARCP